MEQPRVFYLKNTNDDNRVVTRFIVTNPDTYHSFNGECQLATGWLADDNSVLDWDHVADVYCKWDSCTHWWFRGEDYTKEFDNADSYYHLCGAYSFLDHIRCMCFVWKLAYQIMVDSGNDLVLDEYFDVAPTTELVALMLNGYEIVEGEFYDD